MYRKSDLAAAAALEEQKKGLLGRAFDRVITQQLAKVKKSVPDKAQQTDEEFKMQLELERERAEKKGGKKMSARAMELSKQGLSGAVISMMLKDEGVGSEGSDSDSSEDTRERKRRRKEKKKKKAKKKEEKKKKKAK